MCCNWLWKLIAKMFLSNRLKGAASKATMSKIRSNFWWDLSQGVPFGHKCGVRFASPQQVQMAVWCHSWSTAALVTEPLSGKECTCRCSFLKGRSSQLWRLKHSQGNYDWIGFLGFSLTQTTCAKWMSVHRAPVTLCVCMCRRCGFWQCTSVDECLRGKIMFVIHICTLLLRLCT